MRNIALILAGAAIAGCTTAPPPATRSAQSQALYEQMLAGKTAGAPVDCLPQFQANDMRAIDDQTAIFRVSSSKLYVAHFAGSCANLGEPGYALVTKLRGGSTLCRGDISQMVQTSTGMFNGSCVVDSFVPYTSG